MWRRSQTLINTLKKMQENVYVLTGTQMSNGKLWWGRNKIVCRQLLLNADRGVTSTCVICFMFVQVIHNQAIGFATVLEKNRIKWLQNGKHLSQTSKETIVFQMIFATS